MQYAEGRGVRAPSSASEIPVHELFLSEEGAIEVDLHPRFLPQLGSQPTQMGNAGFGTHRRPHPQLNRPAYNISIGPPFMAEDVAETGQGCVDFTQRQHLGAAVTSA
jgi:hypothetical protein